MSEQNRTRGQLYQALNVEEEDDEDDKESGLEEAENATEIEEPQGKSREIESLSTRVKKLRNSRYVRPCELRDRLLVSFQTNKQANSFKQKKIETRYSSCGQHYIVLQVHVSLKSTNSVFTD